MATYQFPLDSGCLATFAREEQPRGGALRAIVLRNAYDTVVLPIQNPHVSDDMLAALADLFNDALNAEKEEAA